MDLTAPLIYLTYFCFVFFMPVFTSSYWLQRRSRRSGWALGLALFLILLGGIAGGALGCGLAFAYIMHTPPQGNNEWGGLFSFVLDCLLFGLPLGVWSGAWYSASLLSRSGEPR